MDKMDFTQLIIDELKAYGFWIALFLAINLTFAFRMGWRGIFVGHLMVAILVCIVDYMWIRSEMKKPDWNGLPDMDLIFYVGVIFRILVINAMMLPLAMIMVQVKKRRKRRVLLPGKVEI